MKLQNIKDVVAIYSDCKKYELSWWNYTDSQDMNVWCSGIIHMEDRDKIIFSCTSRPQKFQPHNYIKTITDLENFVKNSQHLNNDTEIIIVNKDNHHPMGAVFSGSSNIDKKVYFSVYYEDGHNDWKLKLKSNWLKIKCYIKKILKK